MISDEAYKLLKLFSKKVSLSNKELSPYPEFALDELQKENYVIANFIIDTVKIKPELSDYYISDEGIAYLKSVRKNRFNSIFNSTASHIIEIIIAVIIAYIVFRFGWN